jgi:hypothetical protein
MSQLEERFSQPEYWEELISFCVGLKLRGFKRMADRSRMNREVHVRCCGGLEVKFLRSTRLKSLDNAKLKRRSMRLPLSVLLTLCLGGKI